MTKSLPQCLFVLWWPQPRRFQALVSFDKLHQVSREFEHTSQQLLYKHDLQKLTFGGPRGRVVKVADFSALDHSIISPMWVRASHGARIHM